MNAVSLANTSEPKQFKVLPHKKNALHELGGILRVVDANDHGWDVGVVQKMHSTFTKLRIEMDNGREISMVARLAFALADQR